MIKPTLFLQDLIKQRTQTPIAAVLVQTATSDGSRAATQTILKRVLSYAISRSEDPSSDTCTLTFADDLANYASFNPGGTHSKLFQPGVLDTKFVVYLGLEGCVFPNRPSIFIPYARELLQKFTGYVEGDGLDDARLMKTKTLQLIDLTKQFRAQVNDTYPHPLFGNQSLPYFDPTYNLNPSGVDGSGNASVWICDGKMFTSSASDFVYGTTHIDPVVYVDTTGGAAPASVATTLAHTFDPKSGTVQFTNPIPAQSVVSMAGNPTYMAPEVIVRKLLLELGNWSPNFLSLDYSGILLPQFNGNSQTIWDCIKIIAAQTCPRFIPWQIFCDENGNMHFYESRIDGPPVKTFLEGHNILSGKYENSSRQLRTVVRGDATVLTSDGSDQPIVSIAYDIQSIDKYGQTEPLTLTAETTQNVRHLSPTSAVSYLNMLTASALVQVSRPILTCTADIWPDETLQPGDKVVVRQSNLGMDKTWIIKQTTESGSAKVNTHQLVLEEFYDTINYLVGIPSGVQGDTSGLSSGAASPPPTLSIIGAVRAGSGAGTRYAMKDGQYSVDGNGDQVIPVWDANDASAMNFDVYLNSLPQAAITPANNGNQWDYSRRPPGYNWLARVDTVTGKTVFYGTVPTGGTGGQGGLPAGTTVYVGPDSVFYSFNHAAPIVAADLMNVWVPPGNTAIPGVGGTSTYAATPVNVFVWSWWYLNLDSALGAGKFYRPIQRVNPSQDGVAVPINASGGRWVYNPWTTGAIPVDGVSTYYGNMVVGQDDYTATPPGFVGANVLGDGTHVGVAYGLPSVSGNTYTGYAKKTRGHFCVFAANSAGQRQFLRVAFDLIL